MLYLLLYNDLTHLLKMMEEYAAWTGAFGSRRLFSKLKIKMSSEDEHAA